MDTKIFKAYDVRGIYPEEINEEVAYKIGQAYCQVISPKKPVIVGMDVRIHSRPLKEALIKGLIDGGVKVIDVGLISTEMLYFAVGHYRSGGGIQVTASHNPAEYNGFKMTREEVIPISIETGLSEIRDLIIQKKESVLEKKRGLVVKKEILDDFIHLALTFIDPQKIKPFRIAYNPNFGFQGIVLQRVKELSGFQFELFGLNHLPDGTFPKGQPDPFREENRPEFIQFVKDSKVDFGVAWDADADRVFFCTGQGRFIDPYFINAILIKKILEKYQGGKIIYDPRYTWALIEAAKKAGGEAIIERVGHSFIKARMRKERAVFGGESSGHTYFKDFWYADSGLIPLLIILEILSKGTSLEELLKPLFNNYFISGEINKKIKNQKEIFQRIRKKYSDAHLSEIDGLSVEYNEWRANIRVSNTESLLRINVEGKNQEIMEKKRDEIVRIVEEFTESDDLDISKIKAR